MASPWTPRSPCAASTPAPLRAVTPCRNPPSEPPFPTARCRTVSISSLARARRIRIARPRWGVRRCADFGMVAAKFGRTTRNIRPTRNVGKPVHDHPGENRRGRTPKADRILPKDVARRSMMAQDARRRKLRRLAPGIRNPMPDCLLRRATLNQGTVRRRVLTSTVSNRTSASPASRKRGKKSTYCW